MENGNENFSILNTPEIKSINYDTDEVNGKCHIKTIVIEI